MLVMSFHLVRAEVCAPGAAASTPQGGVPLPNHRGECTKVRKNNTNYTENKGQATAYTEIVIARRDPVTLGMT
jgi:hypothetical protein